MRFEWLSVGGLVLVLGACGDATMMTPMDGDTDATPPDGAVDGSTDAAGDGGGSDASTDGGGSDSSTTDGGGCGMLTSCGGDCVDTLVDDANCGGCGMACADYESCVGGTCEASYGLDMRVASPCNLPDPPPDSIADTNCYSDVATRTPAAGLIQYETASKLWADGTLKRRFLVMPDTTSTIGYQERGAWDLPDGTIIIKEFLLETVEGDPTSIQPLETRFIVVGGTRWRKVQYRWNDAGTDAAPYGGGTGDYTVTDASGATSTYTHLFPARNDCQRCHNDAAGQTLGMRTVQMNRDHDYGGFVDNQIRAFDHIGLFGTSLPGAYDTLPRMPIPTDTTAALEDRARSYLEGNCAHCHLPGGPVGASIDLRYQTPFAMTNTCDVVPGSGDVGGMADYIIAAGDHTTSALWLRMDRRDSLGMPARGSLLVDPFGVMLVGDWIDSIAVCP